MYKNQLWMNDRIGAAVRGENPTVITKMKSGFAVFGDYQHLPGYCVLLAYPQADSLNALPLDKRAGFLTDMTLIADAIDEVCSPLRINYAILMNYDHYLHAHIEARYDWEPEEYKNGPTCKYPRDVMFAENYYFETEDNQKLMKKIKQCLESHLEKMDYWGEEKI